MRLSAHVVALEAMLDQAEGIADRVRRRELVVDGFVEQVVVAHRTIAPVDFADPGVRSQPAVAERLDALSARAARVLFGDRPAVDELAGFWMVTDLKPVTRRLSHLPDDELRAALRRLCLRLFPDPAG
jgi:hypothetical protein